MKNKIIITAGGTSEKIDVFDENGQRVLDKIVSFVGVAPMDNPRYIVLAALDTPSRSTGIYISGGVMAAPTVGAILSDILPYLDVERKEALQPTVLPDLTGMTQKQAEKLLKEQNITAMIIGSENTVTAQLPRAGDVVAMGSQIILYCGENKIRQNVVVPDFAGLNRQQAADIAAKAGLCIQITGNTTVSTNVVVIGQSAAAGTQVPPGTTIQLQFADMKAKD